MRTTQCNGIPLLVEPALGIWYDGRTYHFQQFTYARFEDAHTYAKLVASRAGYCPLPLPHEWTQWHDPDADDLARMTQYSIRYHNGQFWLGPYRYDRLDDAVAYARRFEPAPSLDSATVPPRRTGP